MQIGAAIWIFIPSPEFVCWAPPLQCDGFRRWGLWEVLRSWVWSPHEWGKSLRKEAPESSLAPCTTWQHSETFWTKKRALSRTWPRWFPDLELDSPQNSEKQISVAYKLSQFLVFCYRSLNSLRWLDMPVTRNKEGSKKLLPKFIHRKSVA